MTANTRLYPAVAVLLCFLFLAVTTVVYGQETLRMVKITGFTGEVKIMKAGGEKVFPAFIGMGLVQGDRIITAQDSTLTLEMDDSGKEVKIAENSSLLIGELSAFADSQEETSRFDLWAGAIWANIKHKLTSGSRFEIKTPTAVMGARGTKIYVSQEEDKTTYTVIAGSAYVTYTVNVPEPGGSARQVEVEVVLNERQMIELHGMITDPAAVTIREVTLQSLDLFVLEIIKELDAANPGVFDSAFLVQLDELIEKMTEVKNSIQEQDQKKLNLAPLIEYFIDWAKEIPSSGGKRRHRLPALLAAPFLSLAQSFTVDGEIVINFDDNAAWRAAITAVKVDGTELGLDTDYSLAEGTITLKPAGLNVLLTTAGQKAVSVEATGYETAEVSLTILAGGLFSSNCTAEIDSPLAPGETSTVMLTALDQYGNPIQGYKFYLDIVVYDVNQTNDEEYTINGTNCKNDNLPVPFPPLPPLPEYFSDETGETDEYGNVTFGITIPEDVDTGDGVAVTVRPEAGMIPIGAFAYYGL